MKFYKQTGTRVALFLLFILIVFSFQTRDKTAVFLLLASKKTGVTFNNKLIEDGKNNILTYEYFYNGGGLSVGDINNDGLDDIFFTGNMSENKLYLNLGDFKFKDITALSGTKGKNAWTTGVSMVDINGDGFLDIYVCYSGNGDLESRRNQLFINQGNSTFKEDAKSYGLDDPSNSTQALFFDFDKDGDLDMFLLNHHIEVINEVEFDQVRAVRHPFAGDKLYRNDGGKFTDISKAAGIKGSALGFGLGIVASDLNGDGWIDVYVSNDYIEPDYLYINNGDGTFTDMLPDMLQHISQFSMGLDISDINNDGWMDIFTLDMLPEDNRRQKLLYGPENYEHYALMVDEGFHHQNMRNMLHLNQGNGSFSEIGQLAGISNTDWSWSALFFDATNSGQKDLFVSNGYYRDYTDRDFLKFKGNYYFNAAISREKADTLKLVTSMTSTPISNYFFENEGDLKFKDRSKEWGISAPNFSSGAVYSDLNNDGQMDLVINNLNDIASIHQNQFKETTGKKNNYIQLKLNGKGMNTSGIGAKISIHTPKKEQFLEQMPTRGFQSTVSHRLHVGLGEDSSIDSLVVTWPTGTMQVIKNPVINQILEIKEPEKNQVKAQTVKIMPIFSLYENPLPFAHKEYGFNDFKRQPLLLEMPSYIGPVMATADIHANGSLALFIGGSKGFPGKLFENINGDWVESKDFGSESEFTDADAVFFDANGDGYPDLYVCSGGYHDYLSNDDSLQDRLYINDGNGKLEHQPNLLPSIKTSTSTAVVIDVNNDGFPDLFVGGRILPGKYPTPPPSYVLINDGKGGFIDKSKEYLPKNGLLGMVTDAVKLDINKDGFEDLVVVGEYMPIEIFLNENGLRFTLQTNKWIGEDLRGWWTSVATSDFDKDGNLDLIVGNFGTNSPFQPSKNQPLTLYYGDFDENSSIDPILVKYFGNQPFPFVSRDELLDQMYGMRSRFTDYASYSNATIEQILSKEQLGNASKLEVTTLSSVYLQNTGSGFNIKPLPIQAQFAPVHAIHPLDFDNDGNLDFILAGNQNQTRLRIGRIDANFGQVFKGDGKGNFTFIPQQQSGLELLGDVKSILEIPLNPKVLLFGINDKGFLGYKLND